MKKINKTTRSVWVILFAFTTLAMADTSTVPTDVASTSDTVTVTAGEGDVTATFVSLPIISLPINVFDILIVVDGIAYPDNNYPECKPCDIDDDGDVDIFDLLAIIDIMD
jgi:hypothetical protein